MSSSCVVTVLYPNDDDLKFDLDYYNSHHMPLVMEKFKPHGMKGYQVVKLNATPDPSQKSPYAYQATLEFDHPDSVGKALQAEGGPVLGDIPNFTNKQPILMVGDLVVDKMR